jgi:hypothetical protein
LRFRVLDRLINNYIVDIFFNILLKIVDYLKKVCIFAVLLI